MRARAITLHAAGVPLEIPEANDEPGLTIRQRGGPLENCIFDLRCGGTGCAIDLHIFTRRYKTGIDYFCIELPWQEFQIRWLDDPSEFEPQGKVYIVPGSGLEFSRNVVINHFSDLRRPLSAGRSAQGLLLGIASKSMPDEIQHGAVIPASLTVTDQFGDVFGSWISLWADRSERFPKGNRTSRSLFRHRDLQSVEIAASCEVHLRDCASSISSERCRGGYQAWE